MSLRIARYFACALVAVPAGLAWSADAPHTRPAETRRDARQSVDDAHLLDHLLNDRQAGATPRRDVRQLMLESQRRLGADQDPGAGTQYVQEQIVAELDRLIDELYKKRCNPKGGDGCPGTPGPVKPSASPGGGKPASTSTPPVDAGKNSAGKTPGGGDGSTNVDDARDIRVRAEEWGRISPRLIGPVIEGRAERVSEKYRNLVNDYYRGVSEQAVRDAGR